jgi:ribosomal protein L21E
MKKQKINIGENVRIIEHSNMFNGKAGIIVGQLSKGFWLVTLLENNNERTIAAITNELEII